MTWLEYKDGLRELPLDSELVVGTGAQATWRLRHADLLPRHFIVAMSEGGATIRPFSTEAVVAVNGHQLSSGASALDDGDVISAGSAQFRFWTGTPDESRAPLLAPRPIGHLVEVGRRSAVSLHRISTGIGRDESNALVMDEADVSNYQLEIRREAGGHALRASNSTVRVNGKAVTVPVLLEEGDEVQIGDRVLRYTREPLPEGMYAEEAPAEGGSLGVEALELPQPRYSPLMDLPTAVALRNPMRAVAVVSSVIAAVAIATLVFLHQ